MSRAPSLEAFCAFYRMRSRSVGERGLSSRYRPSRQALSPEPGPAPPENRPRRAFAGREQ